MNYWDNKQERKENAERWIVKMEKEFGEEIHSVVGSSRIYENSYPFTDKKESASKFLLINNGSVEAIEMLSDKEKYGKLCVLNFASYKNPGGMFTEGSRAQEEMLCHSSILYNVLSQFPDYYHFNKGHLNRGLYTNRAIYSPAVRFFFEEGNTTCDVITCAAPNRNLARYNRFTDKENYEALQSRAYFIKNITQDNNVDTLILGAWGCGVFKQDPENVASIFKEVFASSSIKNIVFAVPGEDLNYRVFKNYFG